MKIIGLGYKAKSGKDTVAEFLHHTHGYLHYSFAAPLKKVCEVAFGLDDAQLYGDKKEVEDQFWGMTPRKVMQLVGTECFKPVFGKDVWVRMMERHIFARETPYSAKVQGIVISDMRFLVELNAIKSWGGKVVRVDRDGSGASQGVAQHASEMELDGYSKWDAIIDNNGSLDDLYIKATELIR